MKFLDILIKDLRQTSLDWRTPVFMLVMPIVFTIFFGVAFSDNPDADTRVPVAVVNRDDGFISDYFQESIETSTVIRYEPLRTSDTEALEAMILDGDLGALVVIPEGYTDAVTRGEEMQLDVRFDNGTQAGHAARSEIIAILMRGLSAVEAGIISADQRIFEDSSFGLEHAHMIAVDVLQEWENPSVRVETRQGGEREQVNAYAQSSPGMMIQFSVIGIMSSASLLMQERKTRAMDRMLSTPTRPAEIIIGKLLSGFTMVFAQLLILAALGNIFYDLPYFSRPLAFLLLSTTFALTLSSMGLLIGGFAKTDEAVVIMVMIPMFLLSALGGAWFPLETTPQFMQTLGHIITPTAWAMDAYQDIIVRGLGFQSVLLPSLIIFVWGAVFFGLAVRKLRFV